MTKPLDTIPARGRPPGSRPFTNLGVILALILASAACVNRGPSIVPASVSIEAAEGYGQASIQGENAVIKGKFSFLFRRPGLGRVEALDPLAGTIYYLVFDESRAFFVLPSKRAYVEDSPETLMGHFLGFALRPDDILRLLSGRWAEPRPENDPGDLWQVEKDRNGRVVRAGTSSLVCTIQEFFGESSVPRLVLFSAAGTSGRMKVLTIRFNPPPRPQAFETPFLSAYSRRSWEEIRESLKDER